MINVEYQPTTDGNNRHMVASQQTGESPHDFQFQYHVAEGETKSVNVGCTRSTHLSKYYVPEVLLFLNATLYQYTMYSQNVAQILQCQDIKFNVVLVCNAAVVIEVFIIKANKVVNSNVLGRVVKV
jgi:hypothetical protein